MSRTPVRFQIQKSCSVLHRSFLFALRFAITQAGIAAGAQTLMQGSEEKE